MSVANTYASVASTSLGPDEDQDLDEGFAVSERSVFDPLTRTGAMLGTPAYMSPEQAASDTEGLDTRTDIYSLGAMLYYLCTGRPPFETDNPVDTLLRILDSEPVMPNKINPTVPRDVAVICARCLEKDPKNRYQTAQELVQELDRFLTMLGQDPGVRCEADDGLNVREIACGMRGGSRSWARRPLSCVGPRTRLRP